MAARFDLTMLMARPRVRQLLSFAHFSVNGTDLGAFVDEESDMPADPGEAAYEDSPLPSRGRDADATNGGIVVMPSVDGLDDVRTLVLIINPTRHQQIRSSPIASRVPRNTTGHTST